MIKYGLYKRISNTPTQLFDTYEEAKACALRVAEANNYGRFRFWQDGGFDFYDCGPVVYRIKALDEDELKLLGFMD